MHVDTSLGIVPKTRPRYAFLASRDSGAKWQFVLDFFKLPAAALWFFGLGVFTWRTLGSF